MKQRQTLHPFLHPNQSGVEHSQLANERNVRSFLGCLHIPNHFVLGMLSVLLFVAIACQTANEERQQHTDILIESLSVPCREGGMPNLFLSQSGKAYLSWVEFIDDSTDALVFSVLEESGWSEEKEIARGTNWFVNWADFPSLLAFSNDEQILLAHWLQKSDKGTYDYDIRISLSANGGRSWSQSKILNDDGVAAEHGFVSLLPLPDGSVQALWLDGRQTKKEQGAMSLRTTTILPEGEIKPSILLDERTCDCCQTDLVATSNGLLAAYRDRSASEIRDIALINRENDKWTSPYLPHPDNWHIAGCPVNGPALAARKNELALVWFSGAKDTARVQLSFSRNGGKSFGPRFRIDEGNPLGRVDVELSDEGTACISWLEKTEQGAEIRFKEVNAKGETLLSQSLVATSPARDSGFPILLRSEKRTLLLAYTSLEENGRTRVRCLKLKLPEL